MWKCSSSRFIHENTHDESGRMRRHRASRCFGECVTAWPDRFGWCWALHSVSVFWASNAWAESTRSCAKDDEGSDTTAHGYGQAVRHWIAAVKADSLQKWASVTSASFLKPSGPRSQRSLAKFKQSSLRTVDEGYGRHARPRACKTRIVHEVAC